MPINYKLACQRAETPTLVDLEQSPRWCRPKLRFSLPFPGAPISRWFAETSIHQAVAQLRRPVHRNPGAGKSGVVRPGGVPPAQPNTSSHRTDEHPVALPRLRPPVNFTVGLLQSSVETVLKSLLLSAKGDRTNPVTVLKCIDNVNTPCLHYRYGCVFRSQWHHFCLE